MDRWPLLEVYNPERGTSKCEELGDIWRWFSNGSEKVIGLFYLEMGAVPGFLITCSMYMQTRPRNNNKHWIAVKTCSRATWDWNRMDCEGEMERWMQIILYSASSDKVSIYAPISLPTFTFLCCFLNSLASSAVAGSLVLKPALYTFMKWQDVGVSLKPF